MSVAPDSDRRKQIAEFEKELESGKDEKGVALTDEQVKDTTIAVKQRKSELAELAALEVVPPNMTFDNKLTLQLGKRRI
jgi:hypothetical protein